jgi:hypothetical protein
VFVKRTPQTADTVRTEPAAIGILNSIFNAMAAPKISAIAVATAAPTAESRISREAQGFRCRVADSERQSPVTIPRCAALCCSRISMTVESVMTQRRLQPNSEPAAMFEAQFPGSIKPTVTSRPGPRYFRNSWALALGAWRLMM